MEDIYLSHSLFQFRPFDRKKKGKKCRAQLVIVVNKAGCQMLIASVTDPFQSLQQVQSPWRGPSAIGDQISDSVQLRSHKLKDGGAELVIRGLKARPHPHAPHPQLQILTPFFFKIILTLQA